MNARNAATDKSEIIRNWFARESGGGVILPDGWFGRPYDIEHQLTSVKEADDTLVLILDGSLTMNFSHLRNVEQRGSELVLYGFEELRCEFGSWADTSLHHRAQYTEGEVRFVSLRLQAR